MTLRSGRAWGILGAGLLLLAFLALPGAPGDEGDGSTGGTVVLYLTGETRGVLEPCGCTSGQLGGIARRDAFLSRERPAEHGALVLDHGGLVDRPGRQAEIKFGVSLDAMGRMEYALANVGRGDLLMGVGRLLEATSAGNVEFVSANLRLEGQGRPFPAYRVVRAGEIAVAVFGILSPSFGPELGAGSYLFLDDPVESLREPVAAARNEARVLVLLAHAPAEEARKIAEALPDLDLVVFGSAEEEPTLGPARTGATTLVSPGAMGRFVEKVTIDLGAEGRPREIRCEAIPMDSSAGESERMKAILSDYQDRLELERVLEDRRQGPHPAGKYLGSEGCRDCHQLEYEVWQETRHAHAYDILVEKGHAWDPECAECHSTGFAYESGFVSPRLTPSLDGVGCEACHGPAEAHAVQNGVVKTEPVDAPRCRTCHTPTQTPHFDFESFFEKIKH